MWHVKPPGNIKMSTHVLGDGQDKRWSVVVLQPSGKSIPVDDLAE